MSGLVQKHDAPRETSPRVEHLRLLLASTAENGSQLSLGLTVRRQFSSASLGCHFLRLSFPEKSFAIKVRRGRLVSGRYLAFVPHPKAGFFSLDVRHYYSWLERIFILLPIAGIIVVVGKSEFRCH